MDKWLWAARFFKTRALAARACELGRVSSNGQPAKSARPVRVGDLLQVKNEGGDFQVEVLLLSDVRGPAAVAQTLYRETEASRRRAPGLAEERKAMPRFEALSAGNPRNAIAVYSTGFGVELRVQHSTTRIRPPPRSWARSACRHPSLNWLPGRGMPSSSAPAITASPAPLTWPAPASASWCSRAGHAWVAPAPSKSPSLACACLPALILPDFCIRWWSMSWAWLTAAFIGRPLRTASLCPFSTGPACNSGMTMMPAKTRSGALPPRDVKGWKAMTAVIRRLRDALRPAGDRDVMDWRRALAGRNRRSPGQR